MGLLVALFAVDSVACGGGGLDIGQAAGTYQLDAIIAAMPDATVCGQPSSLCAGDEVSWPDGDVNGACTGTMKMTKWTDGPDGSGRAEIIVDITEGSVSLHGEASESFSRRVGEGVYLAMDATGMAFGVMITAGDCTGYDRYSFYATQL